MLTRSSSPARRLGCEAADDLLGARHGARREIPTTCRQP